MLEETKQSLMFPSKERAQWIKKGGGVGTAVLVSGIVLKQYYENSDGFFFSFVPLNEGQIRESIQIPNEVGRKRLY